MCDLSGDVNNTFKTIIKVWNTQSEIYINNTIEYDVKSYQVNIMIAKCTRILIRGFKFYRSQK